MKLVVRRTASVGASLVAGITVLVPAAALVSPGGLVLKIAPPPASASALVLDVVFGPVQARTVARTVVVSTSLVGIFVSASGGTAAPGAYVAPLVVIAAIVAARMRGLHVTTLVSAAVLVGLGTCLGASSVLAVVISRTTALMPAATSASPSGSLVVLAVLVLLASKKVMTPTVPPWVSLDLAPGAPPYEVLVSGVPAPSVIENF